MNDTARNHILVDYPRDCWYVVATAAEVGYGFTARRVLDTSVVLFRLSDGAIAALEDRCAHRPYPLSAGHREDDFIVCGYHGCTYDATGRWVSVRSQDNPPSSARVRAFPVVERGPFVWIWAGTPGGERLRPPPATPWLHGDGWTSVGERREVAASLQVLHEHYLDLSNVVAMHPEMVPPGIEALPPLEDVEVSEVSVSYRRELPEAPLAPWEAEVTGLDDATVSASFGRTETGTFVTPGLHKQTYSIIGATGPALELVRTHGFTPRSSGVTHVFLQISWRGASVSPDIGKQLIEVFHAMADRDIAVLETVQRCLDEDPMPRRYVNVKADRAAVRARRILTAMVEDERGV
ncbi:vanillate O-demethylase monooxygenase subunit [Gordonia malaquae]|uniref:Vanillate demethylase oxygenase subunit n=1 Tax=Gordonia malaquae NBRC 108250 TaxID=1223542 RepID=M3TDZ6_GORML|nr:aromatic ring-hydroxylating dioxygenase subunit alpha [Gordonia malaquae]GAC79646.1 vanillate demethylase oxygenase subunit [Gordonia malaquae NBRC 108250]SED78870.1 vanillate O-demethylase monooxygenase subunit [Gordonia malaquae]